jgi:large subunit ribosomal protein L11
MATKTVKLQLVGGSASPGKVGQSLGAHGVNIMAFIRDFNAATERRRGELVPVEITIREDRSFEMVLRTAPASYLLRQAASAGEVTREQLRDIAQIKLPDLNTDDLAAAERTIAGTARSMGLTVKEP